MIKKLILKSKMNIFNIIILIFISIPLLSMGCLMKEVIGIPCPGCGLTRAWINFLKGNITEAFYYNPLFLFIPILIGLILVRLICHNERYIKFLNKGIIVIIISFIVIYIIRMIYLFPNIEPMTINKNSVFIKLISKIIFIY